MKITDFGISRARGGVSLTQTGVVKGTPAYLAPEVARGQEPDEASDVYSLGATLYACLEGMPPFGMTENPLEMLYRVAGGDFTRPRSAGALTRPLMRMLDSEPGKRPTMAQVRDQLAGLAAGRDRDVTDVLAARTPIPTTLTDIRPVDGRAMPAVPPPAGQSVTAPVPDPAPPLVPTPDEPPVAAAPPDAEPVGAPARTAVEPAAVPAVGPPAVTTPAPARPTGRRRGAVLLGALAAVLVAVGVLLFLLGQDGDRTEAAAQTSTNAPTPSPKASPLSSPTASETTAPSTSATPATTAPTTTAPPGTTAAETTAPPPAPPTPAGPEPGSAAEVQQALTSYYALLPGDPETAWERTGPTLRAAEPRADYFRFWNRFSSVALGPVSASDDSLTATAPVTYVEDGARLPEQHRFTFVRADDGQLLVDSDRPQ